MGWCFGVPITTEQRRESGEVKRPSGLIPNTAATERGRGPSGPPAARAARPRPERPGERSEQEREVERSEQEREVERSEQERETTGLGAITMFNPRMF